MDCNYLEDLQKQAMRDKKYLYCWKPSDSSYRGIWTVDPLGKRETYKTSSGHCFKAIITPYGSATIHNPDSSTTYIDAPLPDLICETSNQPFELVTGGDKRKNPDKALYRSMTINEVRALSYGDHVWFKANDGTARQIKVNGKVRTWVRDKDRIEVPCKYGMYECFTFTRYDIDRLLIRLN